MPRPLAAIALLTTAAAALTASGEIVTLGEPRLAPTAGALLAQVRARCEAGRAALGPFFMEMELVDAHETATTAYLWLRDDAIRATLPAGPDSAGVTLRILQVSQQLYSDPPAALEARILHDLLTVLTFPFDCDQVAADLGLPDDAVVAIETTADATYYRLEPTPGRVRWVDADGLCVAQEWWQREGGNLTERYNEWSQMGGDAWYPETFERLVGETVVMRWRIVDIVSDPDLDPALFDPAQLATFDDLGVGPWSDLEFWEAPADTSDED